MPNNIINKDAKRGYGTKKTLEKKWDRADKAADKSGAKDHYALTNYIYQNSLKSSNLTTVTKRQEKIRAVASKMFRRSKGAAEK